MTPVRFSMAVLAASVLFAATTPAQKARILWREYQARRDALSKSIGPDALFYLRKDDILGSEIFIQLPAADQASMRAAVTRSEGLGIHIEDDVLITAGEPKVLSAGAPRTVKDIEAWMATTR
jgi:Xaa-Pro aminopeptidase